MINSFAFVVEAVMLAIHGNIFVPEKPVTYLIPSSTIRELYELQDDEDQIVSDEEEAHVREAIQVLIAFFESPFLAKKVKQSITAPWGASSLYPLNDKVSISVINALENGEFGELFDVVETELILTCQHFKAPLLTDQLDLIERIVEDGIEVLVVDIDDFEFVVEAGLPEIS